MSKKGCSHLLKGDLRILQAGKTLTDYATAQWVDESDEGLQIRAGQMRHSIERHQGKPSA